MNGLPEEADPSSAEWNEANVTVECPWFRSGKPSKDDNETVSLLGWLVLTISLRSL